MMLGGQPCLAEHPPWQVHMLPEIRNYPQRYLAGFSFFGNPFEQHSGWTEENEIGRLWVRYMAYLHQQQDSSAANAQRGGAITAGAATAASPAGRTVASQLDVSMNLSSGSSSSEEEDEDDDEDDEEDGDD